MHESHCLSLADLYLKSWTKSFLSGLNLYKEVVCPQIKRTSIRSDVCVGPSRIRGIKVLGLYTPYGGFNSASQISRKLGVFDQKLEESHYLFDYLFDIY